jgi:hypothetical protein
MTQTIAQGTRFFEQFGRIDHILREGAARSDGCNPRGVFYLER